MKGRRWEEGQAEKEIEPNTVTALVNLRAAIGTCIALQSCSRLVWRDQTIMYVHLSVLRFGQHSIAGTASPY